MLFEVASSYYVFSEVAFSKWIESLLIARLGLLRVEHHLKEVTGLLLRATFKLRPVRARGGHESLIERLSHGK